MFDERIKEIIFFQTQGDRVKYIAEELDKPISLSVHNFFKMLKESKVIPANIFDFNKAFDSFETIKLKIDTGHWQVVNLDNNHIKDQKEKPEELNMQEGLKNTLKENKNNLTDRLEKLYNITKDKKDIFDKKYLNIEKENDIYGSKKSK